MRIHLKRLVLAATAILLTASTALARQSTDVAVSLSVNGGTAPVTVNSGDVVSAIGVIDNTSTAGGGPNTLLNPTLSLNYVTNMFNVQSTTCPPGWDHVSGTVTNTVSAETCINPTTMAAGATASMTVSFVAQTSGTSGDLSLSYQSESPDPVSSNNTSTITVSIANPGSISGTAYHDFNSNLSQDSGDTGLQGWTIELRLSGQEGLPPQATATTDANGDYTFGSLTPNAYVVSEVVQNGWFQSEPENLTYDVVVSGGQQVSGIDFGNYQKGSISGTKYHDLNGNGSRDVGEPGLQGWVIQLMATGVTPINILAEATTDVNGDFSFQALAPGDYTIGEVAQTDWFHSEPTSTTYTRTLISGQAVSGLLFGNFQNGSITGRKFEDVDGNATFDSSEPGLQGWVIRLDGPTGSEITPSTTDTTDVAGAYMFTNLRPGNYTVTEVLQTGWTQTFPVSGQHDVTITSGLNVDPRDFGNMRNPTGSISGRKYHDLNADGTRDSGEAGLSGWVIQLLGPGPSEINIVAVDTTDAQGDYSFDQLAAGNYTVTEVQQTGWIQSAPATVTHDVSLAAGQEIAGLDFGNYQLGGIAGVKWSDDNGDGVQDSNETKLAGWVIQLVGPTGSEITPTTIDTTDAGGNYGFFDLKPGSYTVTEIQQTGWTQTFPVSGQHDVTLISGQTFETLDFGNKKDASGSISGTKFHDLNADGTRDSGEAGLSGWVIQLLGPGPSEINIVAVDTTDAQGDYYFDQLAAGNYTVTEVQQTGWIQSAPATVTHDVSLAAGQEIAGLDFGNYQLGGIAGVKWSDDNGDGVQDASEAKLAGWVIQLAGPTGSEIIPTTTDTTDAGGDYGFFDLKPGSYTVTEIQQTGWTQTFPVSGQHDVTLISGQTFETLDFGNRPPQTGVIEVQKILDLNGDGIRGELEPGLDGVRIVLSNTVGGRMDTLLTRAIDRDDDGNIHPVNEHGWAIFDQLPPGSYTVSEIAPEGLTMTFPETNLYTVDLGVDESRSDLLFLNAPESGHLDWGDLPDPRFDSESVCASSDPCFPTLNRNRGPFHVIGPNPVVLGQIVDGESDGQPERRALGDDDAVGSFVVNYASPGTGGDDEDGLERIARGVDNAIILNVRVTDPLTSEISRTLYLDAWVDRDGDGRFTSSADPSDPARENIFVSAPVRDGLNVLNSGPLTADVYPEAGLGFIRLRLSSTGNLPPTGPALDGEVEDYEDVKYDYGDAPSSGNQRFPDIPSGYPTTDSQNGARHRYSSPVHLGQYLDTEADGQPGILALQDDSTRFDDEDGVEFSTGFLMVRDRIGVDSVLTPLAVITGTTQNAEIIFRPSVDGFIDAWLDTNGDGDWDDTDEYLLQRAPVASGTDTVPVTLPNNMQTGLTFLRIRYSTSGIATPTGTAEDGEVEDYLIRVADNMAVGSSGDGGDANPGDGVCDDGSGQCTLRAAIEEANTVQEPTVLTFSSFGKSGVVIQPTAPLPTFRSPILLLGENQLEIDGSQAGANANGITIATNGSAVNEVYIHSFSGDGVQISGNDNTVRGVTASGNGGAGVGVLRGIRNRITLTLVYGNTGEGIDLGGDGRTTNDADDSDDGPNNSQNYPILVSVTAENGRITGLLPSNYSGAFRIEFFAASACGTGVQRYIGSAESGRDAADQHAFDTTLSTPFSIGDSITATATDSTGNSSELSECFEAVTTAVEALDTNEVPDGFHLDQNYPNPFNPVTTVRFSIPTRSAVRIELFDMLGRMIRRVVDGSFAPGEYQTRLDASGLPSGMYLYRMTAGSFARTRSLTLLK
jgi:allantoicase